MKYVYTAGQYICFMGRMFAFGQPQEVNDKATIEALKKRKDFSEWQEPKPAPIAEKRPVLGISKRK